MNESMVVIENGSISAEISLLGAELRVLRKNDGENVMWAADTDHWNRVSPNLFPIVGRLKGDQYSVDGQVYEMRQHGFARDQFFEVIEASADEVAMRLV
jgi:galactose mutarotase-like enzyme